MFNHFTMLHWHCPQTDQPDKVARDFTGGNHAHIMSFQNIPED